MKCKRVLEWQMRCTRVTSTPPKGRIIHLTIGLNLLLLRIPTRILLLPKTRAFQNTNESNDHSMIAPDVLTARDSPNTTSSLLELIQKELLIGGYDTGKQMRSIMEPRKAQFRTLKLGLQTYLAVVEWDGLDDEHLIIVPTQHCSSTIQLDENVWDEMRLWRKGLVALWKQQNRDCVFFEMSRHVDSNPHVIVECVPLDQEIGDMTPIYFKMSTMEGDAMGQSDQKDEEAGAATTTTDQRPGGSTRREKRSRRIKIRPFLLPNDFRTIAALTSAHDVYDGGEAMGRSDQKNEEAGDATTTTNGSATRRQHREGKELQKDKNQPEFSRAEISGEEEEKEDDVDEGSEEEEQYLLGSVF
uniref:CwfJ_C_1 domain-containing protein n=2 Tax=Caenorhabditis tropicalis TaxID=1561998 RepID=A0A1I7TL15_9PELO